MICLNAASLHPSNYCNNHVVIGDRKIISQLGVLCEIAFSVSHYHMLAIIRRLVTLIKLKNHAIKLTFNVYHKYMGT